MVETGTHVDKLYGGARQTSLELDNRYSHQGLRSASTADLQYPFNICKSLWNMPKAIFQQSEDSLSSTICKKSVISDVIKEETRCDSP